MRYGALRNMGPHWSTDTLFLRKISFFHASDKNDGLSKSKSLAQTVGDVSPRDADARNG